MKKEKEKVLYYPVIIHTRANTWVTRNRDEDDEWDKDDTETSTDVLGVETEKDKREQRWFRDVVVPFEVVPGKDYYLVYVTYSTGDSFSRPSTSSSSSFSSGRPSSSSSFSSSSRSSSSFSSGRR